MMQKYLRLKSKEAGFIKRALAGNCSLLDDPALYDKLYCYFLQSGEMPYGVAKARTGDPEQWILDRLDSLKETV